jgi:hypothetical protein
MSEGKCERMNPHIPKGASTLGAMDLQRMIVGVKTQWIEEFSIPLESSWNIDV